MFANYHSKSGEEYFIKLAQCDKSVPNNYIKKTLPVTSEKLTRAMAVGGTTTMIQAHGHRIIVKTPLAPPEASTANDDELPPTASQSDVSLHVHSVQLLNPESITSEFDKLRFEAAAHDQLVFHNPQLYQTADDISKHSTPNQDPETLSTLLISSPYNIPNHYLDLSSPHLTIPSRLLALALTALKPATLTYATTPYPLALNFSVVLALLRTLIAQERYEWKETAFYVVVFRSQLKEDIDQEWLYRLDEESHREACESGGLLKYWFGKGDEERRNLATCTLCLLSLFLFSHASS